MEHKPSAGASAFAAVGCLLMAWHFAPRPGSDPMRWVLAGMFAFAGLVLILQWLKGAEARPSPWQSPLGRIAWALRPRSWIIAWAAIFIAGRVLGTPHIVFDYPPRTSSNCIYVGLWGAKRAPLNGGALNGCSLTRLL